MIACVSLETQYNVIITKQEKYRHCHDITHGSTYVIVSDVMVLTFKDDQYCKDIDQYFEINTDNEQLNSKVSKF